MDKALDKQDVDNEEFKKSISKIEKQLAQVNKLIQEGKIKIHPLPIASKAFKRAENLKITRTLRPRYSKR